MPPGAKKHHYIPQSVLRRFSIADERRSVFVFDKQALRSFASPISDAGAERDFYSFTLAGQEVNFEPFFQRLDDRLASLVSKVVDTESLSGFTVSERYDLAIVTACQLLRTKLQRTSPGEIVKQLTQRLRDEGMEPPADFDDSDAALVSFQRLLALRPIADLLAAKDLILLISREADFWTSDNPVILQNTFPAGRPALAAPGVEIYHPLTPHLCLAFLCPSIREILTESVDPKHPRPEPKDPLMRSLLRSLQEDSPLSVSSTYPEFLNSLQIGHSSRFLYSRSDNFEVAEQVLTDHPQLREVRTLVSVGRMGSAPPPDPRMPPGMWLAIEVGHRHHMLPVERLNEGSWTIDFTTADSTKLSLIEPEAPFDCITLFVDSQPTDFLRDVEFVHINSNGHEFVRVQHSDASMNALMDKIHSERK